VNLTITPSVCLDTLKDFPTLLKLKKLDLHGNIIKNGLENLKNCPNLQFINLSNNLISSLEELDSLALLKNLKQLDLYRNPVVELAGYKAYIKNLLPNLNIVEGAGTTLPNDPDKRKIYDYGDDDDDEEEDDTENHYDDDSDDDSDDDDDDDDEEDY